MQNGTILTFDSTHTVLNPGQILIQDGIIVQLGETVDLTNIRVEEVVDAEGGLILPGLVNAHTHSPENLQRGVADRLKLEQWLPLIWRDLDQLTPRQNYLAALLGCIEMLKTGVTSVIDHFRAIPQDLDRIEAVVNAYTMAGLRATIAIMIRDRIHPGDLPATRSTSTPLISQSLPELVDICEEAIQRWHAPEKGIQIMLGPSAPHRCTDQLLERMQILSKQYQVGVHTHVDETQVQAEIARQLYGKSAMAHLHDLALLTPDLFIAHGVWIEPTDIPLLAHHGVSVVHNPVSNLRLGSGVAPIPALYTHGVNIALGTDGAASNDSQNLFEVLKWTALLPRITLPEPENWLSARDVLSMAIRGGAVATRSAHRLGSLEVGKQADLIILDTNHYAFQPLHDPYHQLVYCYHGTTVRTVIINGQMVVDNQRIRTFDEGAVYQETAEIVKKLIKGE